MQKRDNRSILLMLVLEADVAAEGLRAMGLYPFLRRNGYQSFNPILTVCQVEFRLRTVWSYVEA